MQIFVVHFHTRYLTSLLHKFTKKKNPNPWANQGQNIFFDKNGTFPRMQSRCTDVDFQLLFLPFCLKLSLVQCSCAFSIRLCTPALLFEQHSSSDTVSFSCPVLPSNPTPRNVIGPPGVPLEKSLCYWSWGLILQTLVLFCDDLFTAAVAVISEDLFPTCHWELKYLLCQTVRTVLLNTKTQCSGTGLPKNPPFFKGRNLKFKFQMDMMWCSLFTVKMPLVLWGPDPGLPDTSVTPLALMWALQLPLGDKKLFLVGTDTQQINQWHTFIENWPLGLFKTRRSPYVSHSFLLLQ